MAQITIEEIKEFLRNKPGYLKEGGKRLKNIFNRRDLTCTISTCKEAIRQVNNELKIKPFLKKQGKEPKILFFDIETSYGLAKVWRPGYKLRVTYDDFIVHPKIICISYKWNNSEEIHSLTWDSYQDDKTMLELFIKELNKADFSVAHNGDKFDIPWIKTRALFHGLEMYPKYTTVDTLKIARYDFKFPSNKLDDLGDYLNIGRKIKTDMSLWDKTIKGDLNALQQMADYCNQDVLLLEEIYNKLSSMTLPAIHIGTLNGKTKQTSPYNGSANIELVKTTSTKAGTIKRLMKDTATGKFFHMSNTNYKKYLEIYKNK